MDYKQLAGVDLDEYRLVEIIGSGGMSAVYRAHQEELARDVAVKVLSSQLATDEAYLTRFTQEARIAASLEHSHIVPVYDFGIYDQMMYVVMRLLTGGTLLEKIQDGPMNKHEVITIITAISQALDYAHGRGIVHRDVKPGNIMFDAQGTCYLVDFGIAKATQQQDLNLTAQNMVLGTPLYMPPEQWQGQTPVPATDQYALAVITYQMVTGVPAFAGSSPQNIMYQHINDTPSPANQMNPDLSADVSQVLAKAMSKSPTDRYPLITNFANALTQALHKPPTPVTVERRAPEQVEPRPVPQPQPQPAYQPQPARQASPAPQPQPQAQASGSNTTSLIGGGIAGLILLVVLIIGGGFAFLQYQNRNNTDDSETDSGVIEPTDIVLTDASDDIPDENDNNGIQLTPLVPVDVVGFDNLPLSQRTTLVNEPTIPVRDAVYSPDGQVIVSAHGDGTIRFWRGSTATTRNAHNESATAVDFTPDGQYVASVGRDNDVKIWRVSDAELVQTLTGHTGALRDVEFSPDGTRLATASEDRSIRIWRVSDWSLEATMTRHTGRVLGIAWSPDSTLLASGGLDTEVFLWDMTTNQFVRFLSAHSEQIRDVDFSTDGSKLVSSSTDDTLKIWDVSSGNVLHSMNGHGRDVWTVLFSPDGTMIASGGRDNNLRLWNAETGDELQNITSHAGWVLGVSFAPDGSSLVSASGDGTIRIWE